MIGKHDQTNSTVRHKEQSQGGGGEKETREREKVYEESADLEISV